MTTALPTELAHGPFAVFTERLVKRYGRETALNRVSLQVPEGAVYLLVGPNGAGKSTTLKLLLDLTSRQSGAVSVLGQDPVDHGPVVRSQIGYVPERLDWGYAWMTVADVLRHHAAYFTSWNADYAERLSHAFDLKPARRLSRISKGEARRVHLVLALAHRPRLLILDEPTDGLDPVMLDESMALLASHLAESPTTVLISTHHVHEIDRLADHVGVLREGKLVLQATRDDLHRMLRRYRVDVPPGWSGAGVLTDSVLRKGAIGSEIQWSVWGDERAIVERFSAAGATVRDVSPLSLEDATLVLLSRKEAP